jgi:type III restriction enzyme
MRLPVVESYVWELPDQGIEFDIDALEPMEVKDTPAKVWLKATRGVNDGVVASNDVSNYEEQTREQYYESVRPQQLYFRLADMIMTDLLAGAEGVDERTKAEVQLRERQTLFPEIVGIVQRYVKKKVTFREGLDPRELGLRIYADKIVTLIRDNILPSAAEEGKLIPVINRFRPTNSTADVNYQTTRPVVQLAKSHLNAAMVQSGATTGGFEVAAIDVLEEEDSVEYYTPNDRQVGLAIPYDYNGEQKTYEPDFVVQMRGGTIIMLEIKGGGGKRWDPNQFHAKNAAAEKWCRAVSNIGRYGQWVFEICEETKEKTTPVLLREILAKHAGSADELPFEVVDPAKAKIWKNAVPLVSIRSLLRDKGYQQSLDDGTWGRELVTWDGHPEFEKGMFVARVFGDAMQPSIPAGSYCLFRPAGPTPPQNEIVLVRHAKIKDPQSGGDWAVRKATFTGAAADTGEWKHGQIKLDAANADVPSMKIDLVNESDVTIVGVFIQTLKEKEPEDRAVQQ